MSNEPLTEHIAGLIGDYLGPVVIFREALPGVQKSVADGLAEYLVTKLGLEVETHWVPHHIMDSEEFTPGRKQVWPLGRMRGLRRQVKGWWFTPERPNYWTHQCRTVITAFWVGPWRAGNLGSLTDREYHKLMSDPWQHPCTACGAMTVNADEVCHDCSTPVQGSAV